MDKDFLKNEIQKVVKFSPSDLQIDQLLMFYEMTVEKNEVMNLTGITEFHEFVIKHFVDSLEITRVIDLNKKIINMIDIGTGAGFPGIPIKIMYPDIDITLFDSLKKRLVYLDEVIEKLSLKNISTVHGRAEEYGRKLEFREKYDIVVSRAVAAMNTLCEITLPFCKIGGSFIAYKGAKGNEELEQAKKCIVELGGKIDICDIYNLSLNEIFNERTLIKILKNKKTDFKYPRSGGKPFKSPLYIE